MYTKSSIRTFLRGTLNFQEGSDANIEPVEWNKAPARQKDFIFPTNPIFNQRLAGLKLEDRLLKCLEYDAIDYLDVFSDLNVFENISEDEQTVVVSFGCGGAEEIGALLMMYPNLKYIGLDIDKSIIEYNNILWSNVPNIFFMQADISKHSDVLKSLNGLSPDLILMIHPVVHDRLIFNKAINHIIPRIAKDKSQVCITCLFDYEVEYFKLVVDSVNKDIFREISLRERKFQDTNIRRQRSGNIFTSTVMPEKNLEAVAIKNLGINSNNGKSEEGKSEWGQGLSGLKGRL